MQLAGLAALMLQAAGAAAADRPTAEAPFSNAEANAQFHVMAGEMAANRQQPLVAAQEFLQALAIQPDPELAERATRLALAARDTGLSMQAARRWLEIEPAALEAREVIARLSLDAGDLKEVEAQAQAIIDGHAGGPDEGYRHVALLLSQTGNEHAAAVTALMQKLAAQKPKSAGAQHALALVALRFDNRQLAEQSARRAVELSGHSQDEVLLIVGTLVRSKRLDETDALIDKLTAKNPQAAAVRYGYARLLLEAGHRDAARSQLEKALRIDPKLDDARFALGVLAVSDKQYPQAEQHLKPLLTGPRSQEAALQLGRLEETRKDYVKALQYYDRVTSGMPAVDALVRRAHVLGELGRLQEGAALLRDAREQVPQLAPRFYRAEADLLIEHDADAAALDVLTEAIGEYPDDQELVYARSLIHERMGQVELAEQDLRGLLQSDPDNVHALNGLGYMLLTNTTRLEEASKLIRRAHELQPDDAAITDSLGWVEFKLGRTEEALKWLQQAYDKYPDPEVAAHLGEVLWTLGEKERARGIWDKSLIDDPEHKVLRETIQRLTQ